MRDNAVQIRCQKQSPPDLDAFKGKEATVQGDLWDLSTRQHMAQNGAEGPNKQGQVTQDVSNMALKTENFEDPLERTPFSACLQVFNRDNTSSSFSKGVAKSLSISMKLTLASSSKPDKNETLPNQLPPQWMRHNYHLLANIISAEMPGTGIEFGN